MPIILSATTTRNAVIKSASLGFGEKEFLDVWLQLDYGSMMQGFGGYALYLPKSFDHHKLESIAGHFIYRVMQVADVDSWGKLVGRTIRVRHSDEWNSRIEAIGHIVRNDWFCPGEDFTVSEKATVL